MERLIEKILRFENTTQNTVAEFNEIFPRNKLSQFLPNLEVEIGEPVGPDTTRKITVGGLTLNHSFVKMDDYKDSILEDLNKEEKDGEEF